MVEIQYIKTNSVSSRLLGCLEPIAQKHAGRRFAVHNKKEMYRFEGFTIDDKTLVLYVNAVCEGDRNKVALFLQQIDDIGFVTEVAPFDWTIHDSELLAVRTGL